MKVLFLTYDGLTDHLGRSQILPYLQGLSSKGNKIFILSLEKEDHLQEGKNKIYSLCTDSEIEWHYQMFPVNGKKIDQVKTSRAFNKKALELARSYQVDLVHCRSYPAALAGRYIQRKTGLKWIFDIRGFWIDERTEGKIWDDRKIMTRMIITWFRAKERMFYKNASAVISLTYKARTIIEQKFPAKNPMRETVVIPCCADYSIFKPSDGDQKKKMRISLGLPEKCFILSYLGSVGSWYLLSEMLDFYKVLLNIIPDAYFLFISGEKPQNILKAAAEHEIHPDRIRVCKASREEVPFYLAAGNCGIAFIKSVFSKSASSPVKWAETLACDIPVVVNNDIGDISTLQHRMKGILVCDALNHESYEKVIKQLLKSDKYAVNTIREESRQYYDLQQGIDSYQNIYNKVSSKNILYIASHRPERAPNQRFRFEQYFSYFEQHGYHCSLSHLIDKSDDEYLYRKGHIRRKAWFLYVKSTIRRLRDSRNLKNFDLIVVAREATMTPFMFFEKYFSKSRNGFIFDFDDSIWLSNVSAANRFFWWMKRPSKTAKIIGMAKVVIAGNQYLAGYARKFNKNVLVIPTTLDTDVYKPPVKTLNQKHEIVIGWTGSITTIPHFEYIIPVLLKLKEKYGEKIRFEVVGDTQFFHAGLGIIGKAWSIETEIESTASFDIGIMPLPDDEWTQGKCGFKGLLCMSVGVPVIMSPVGVNKEIIQDGINGFLADGEKEWFDKLCILIDNEDIRNNFARNGRQTVIARYSANVWRDNYIKIFDQLTRNGTLG